MLAMIMLCYVDDYFRIKRRYYYAKEIMVRNFRFLTLTLNVSLGNLFKRTFYLSEGQLTLRISERNSLKAVF